MSVLTIEVSDELRQVWPQFRGAAVFAEVRNTPYSESLWKRIGDYTALYRERYTVDSIKEMPAIQATRQAYKKCGKDPSRYRPSSEALCRRILRRDYRRMAGTCNSGTVGRHCPVVTTHQSRRRASCGIGSYLCRRMYGSGHSAHAIQRVAGRTAANKSRGRLGRHAHRPPWQRNMAAKRRHDTARRYMRLRIHHPASGSPAHQQDRIYLLPQLRAYSL